MATAKHHRQYLRTQVQTASKEQLVLMLLDGVIRFAEKGKNALLKSEWEEAHVALMRSQAIIMELFYCLDREQGGEIADNLSRLYAYAFQRLIEANMKHSGEPIDEVQKIFRELRSGWSEAMTKVPGSPPAPGPIPAGQDKVSVNNDEAPPPADPAGGQVDRVEMSGKSPDEPVARASSPTAGTAVRPRPTMATGSAPTGRPTLSVQG